MIESIDSDIAKPRRLASKTKMNICFISNFPPARGRLAEYAYCLINELQRIPQIGHIDIIASTNTTKRCVKVSHKINLHQMWNPDKILPLFLVPFKILSLKPDVVHFNYHMAVFGSSRLANFIGLSIPFVCRLMGFKTLVTLHNITDRIDIEKTGFKNTLLNRLGALIATKILTLASTITLTVKSYVRILKERYNCERTLWIPHGTWKMSVDFNHDSHSNPKTILYIGHSGPYKDLSLLFEAFKTLKQRRSDLKLIVAGSSHPNYPGFLKKYEFANSQNIEFTGYVPDDQLSSLFERVNVVVLPYHTCTGTSGVAHLVSSYGVPIIATDLPEFRDLANEGCGIILSPHNSEALAERMEYVLDNSKLSSELRERTLFFARERTWDKIAAQFYEAYKELS